MKKHEWPVVERLTAYQIAVFQSTWPENDVTKPINIGLLFPLFFASACRTYEKETGQLAGEQSRHRRPGGHLSHGAVP